MFKKIINTVFILIWFVLAINPYNFKIWFIENILVFIVFPLVVWLDKKYKFSNLAYFGLFVFASLHLVGAHFTYGKIMALNGSLESFSFIFNYYDNIVHFLFGFFGFLPLFEISKSSQKSIRMRYFLSILLIMSIASAYELLEWLAVVAVYPEEGSSKIITQGDEWDAQKDMALALAGSLMALLLCGISKRLHFDHCEK